MTGRSSTMVACLLAAACGCSADDSGLVPVPDIVEESAFSEILEITEEVTADIQGEPDVPAPYGFEEYPWMTEVPDLDYRLCPWSDDPEAAPDKVFIDCEMEGESFASPDEPPRESLVVMAYNLERGKHLDDQIALLRDYPEVPLPDVLLVSEADRGCSRSGRRHVTRDLAQALGMNYVFAVEFVELPRESGGGDIIEETCEHGNAILSRYPLGNVRQIRHETNLSWYAPPGTSGQPRLGGRVAVYADVMVGERFFHVYSVHFESDIDHAQRTAQAAEIAQYGLSKPFTVVAGGDMNSGVYFLDVQSGEQLDPTVMEFTQRDYQDAHWGLPYDDRVTSPEHGMVLDLIMGLNASFSGPMVGPGDKCDGLSDHRPVWATLDLQPALQ